MSTPPRTPQRTPRARSAFAAAFLSLLFPGLGHAYAGAWGRALGFAAPPLLSLALLAGILLRADRIELLGFVIQQPVLIGLFVLNAVVLLYRIVAAVDAWQVARFLNDVDASGGGRLGRARLPLSPLSVAGLLAVLLVMAGGHLAVARYNALALDLVNCVFSDSGDATCESASTSPSPGASDEPSASNEIPVPTDSPEAVETAIPNATGTLAPTLPPWNGTDRLNVLLVGVDQRQGESYFNTDTMIVVSVDPVSKQVAMFQVPRDTVDVPVPPNAQRVWGSVYRGKINSWFVANRGRSDLWPGSNDNARGFAALKAILGQLYGLQIQYYVKVNFDGFTQAVDTLGGVEINVQIPVAESTYPITDGANARIYIPAGPQEMTGSQALIYARSRHRATDFDRGLRQQRVLLSLREQMDAQSIVAHLTDLVNTLKSAVKTDVKTSDLPKLLALAQSVDTKDIRSYVFAPSYYATEYANSPRGYIIEPNVARIRAAVKDAFTVDAQTRTLREQLGQEAAQVWVLNGTSRSGLASTTADYLGYYGLDASAPNQAVSTRPSTTKIVFYNGAEATMPKTIKYLDDLFGVQVTTATDPKVTVDVIITLGRDAPNLEAPAVG